MCTVIVTFQSVSYTPCKSTKPKCSNKEMRACDIQQVQDSRVKGVLSQAPEKGGAQPLTQAGAEEMDAWCALTC